jgi:hypothetical protein
MFKSIWIRPSFMGIKRYKFLLEDDNFSDWCECELDKSCYNRTYDNLLPWEQKNLAISGDIIVASTKVIIRIYTQRQGNIAKNIWLYFRQQDKEHNYGMENLIRINKERNPSYVYHEKEVDELVEKYGVLL